LQINHLRRKMYRAVHQTLPINRTQNGRERKQGEVSLAAHNTSRPQNSSTPAPLWGGLGRPSNVEKIMPAPDWRAWSAWLHGTMCRQRNLGGDARRRQAIFAKTEGALTNESTAISQGGLFPVAS
jgi:hypothetical protein